MKYLTYDEYVAMGGTLEASEFAENAAEAQAHIDRHTFRRVRNMTVIPDSVKACMFALADVLYSASASRTGEAIASESNDGVSVSYVTSSPTESDERLKSQIDKTICLWLSGEVDDSGTPLLWRGVDNAL